MNGELHAYSKLFFLTLFLGSTCPPRSSPLPTRKPSALLVPLPSAPELEAKVHTVRPVATVMDTAARRRKVLQEITGHNLLASDGVLLGSRFWVRVFTLSIKTARIYGMSMSYVSMPFLCFAMQDVLFQRLIQYLAILAPSLSQIPLQRSLSLNLQPASLLLLHRRPV